MPRTLPKFSCDRANNPLELDPLDRDQPTLNSFNSPQPSKTSLLQKLVMLGAGAFALGIVITPALLSHQQPHVISIRANDLSDSALAGIEIARRHCTATTRSLKEGDYAVSIGFADRPEVIQAEVVSDLFALSKECKAVRRDRIPPALGKQHGTDLSALLEEVQTLLKSQRTRDNHNPGVITIWLQNAEPCPGEAVLNLNQVRSQLQQITNDRSTIAIFGPTGQLRRDLEKTIQNNPRVELCPIDSSETCVKQAFNKGRSLP